MADSPSAAELRAAAAGAEIVDDDVAVRNGKAPTGWPKLPGFNAALQDIRHYLTQAAGLPHGWTVDLAERHGPDGSHPMTVHISILGQQYPIKVRFGSQREASKPGALRGTFMEATRGASRMRYPKPAQASDFYAMLCALAHVTEDRTTTDETIDWCQQFVETAQILDLDLGVEHRYDSLMALRARGEFDAKRAKAYLSDNLEPGMQHVAVMDPTDTLWMRAGELATWIRHMKGAHISQDALDARLNEIDVDRLTLEVDKRRKGFAKVRLVMYRAPSDPAFPIPIRIHTPPGQK